MNTDSTRRIALVTSGAGGREADGSGAGGIGFGCARVLSEAGASVIINDINNNKDNGAAACSTLGSSTRFVSDEDVLKLVSYIECDFGNFYV